MLALPGVQLLDISGPLDVFAEANVQAGYEAYRLFVLADQPGAILSSSGVRLMPDGIIGRDLAGRVDTLLVAGRPNAAELPATRAVIEWLQRRASTVRRLGSVCSGAFVLAAAGLLDGRRVTTHWAVAERLAQQFPKIQVQPDALQVRDGSVRTSAGVTAGLDLALSLVEEDLGLDVAMRVASQLVMFFKRPGGQLQFSRKSQPLLMGRSALQELQRWIAANPSLDHSVASLAKRMGMSPRHFSRMFRQEVGVTPAAWVKEARVDAARKLLEQAMQSPKQVAAQCGFANADTLRRAFAQHVGVSPAEYRKRFAGIAV